MATNKTAQFWIRLLGDNANGGGFDAGISGAGTNYANQDAAQLSITDAASTAASNVLTSVAGGFTSAMVGNAIGLSGTNFITGRYWITGYTDTNTVTLDRDPTTGGNGSAGTCKVGGAWAHWEGTLTTTGTGHNTTNGASLLGTAGGHDIHLEGSTESPTTSTIDYQATGYSSGVEGVSGVLNRIIPFNGRPAIKCPAAHAMVFWNAWLNWEFTHLFMYPQGTAGTRMIEQVGFVRDCVFDQAGYLIKVCTSSSNIGGFQNNTIQNTGANQGSNSAGFAVVHLTTSYNYAIPICNNVFKNLYGEFALETGSSGILGPMEDNIFENVYSGVNGLISSTRTRVVKNNTFRTIGNDAVTLPDTGPAAVYNNLFVDVTGDCVNYGGDALADVEYREVLRGGNAFYNYGATYEVGTNQSTDVVLTADPFTDGAGGDYSLNNTAGGGAECRGVAIPSTFGATNFAMGTTTYKDIGAVQLDAGGGGGAVYPATARWVA